MKTVFLLLVGFALALGSWAQSSDERGWVPLFNGKDLTGWRPYGAERWVAENGTILGQGISGKYGYLVTENTYRDFLLRVKFRGEPGGNSGVFLRCRIIGENPKWGPDIEAMQVEVDPALGNHTGGLYESGGRGWVMQPSPEAEKAIKPGEWNEMEIAAEGRHIVTRLNGVQVVDFWDTAPRFFEGHIALQVHTGEEVKVRWKDIEIYELPGGAGR